MTTDAYINEWLLKSLAIVIENNKRRLFLNSLVSSLPKKNFFKLSSLKMIATFYTMLTMHDMNDL